MLADIHGQPLIVHTWRRAMEAADHGRVTVATDDNEIANAVLRAGGHVTLTGDQPNGSLRVAEAVAKLKATDEIIINLQGDSPTMPVQAIRMAEQTLKLSGADIATLAGSIREEELPDRNVVKLYGEPALSARFIRGARFSRDHWRVFEPMRIYHHVGLYAFWRNTLARFADEPGDTDLEQRAAERAGLTMAAGFLEETPLQVDTEADLARARELLAVAA